jgi:hypothetical protein
MTELDAQARRIERLRHELIDEGIWGHDDDPGTPLLVTELDYARHPHRHEGTAARYGAIIAAGDPPSKTMLPPELIDIDGASLDVVRLLADGRSSFGVRIVGGGDRLVCFERTREYESSAVHLATNGNGLIVQRLSNGWIRLTTPHRVATWDGVGWSIKALSHRQVERVLDEIGWHDETLVANLLELCTHWLGAGRIGTTIVWRPGGDARELGHLGFNSAVDVPPLDLHNRNHFAAMLNALSQFDRAAIVDGDGRISQVGVQLWSSDVSRRNIPSHRGTRHTSALRFSADAPEAVVFVISSSGTLTICRAGRRLDLG